MHAATIRDRRDAAADVVLTPIETVHLPGAWRLSQELSWPYRLEDWAFALTVGRGFVLERGNDVVGTAAWFPYGDTHATIGMIIVSGRDQGRGLGARLMDRLLDEAGARSLLLNATPEGRALYERRGFRPVGTIHQHQGIPSGRHEAPSKDVVRPVRPADLEAIVRLDGQATGLERGPLLRRLLDVGEAQVLLRDGAPAGYVVSRPFGRGTVVGPVVADTPFDARLLVEAALSRLAGRFVRIDTAAIPELSPWFEAIGLPRVSDALTMVRGTLAPAGPARAFALSNQSFN